MEEFAAVFAALDDPRTGDAKRHPLLEILLIAPGTLLGGGASCADMAPFGRAKRASLAEFLTLPHGIPGHDTLSRVFRLLDPLRFGACFTGRRSCGASPPRPARAAWWRSTARPRAAPSTARPAPRPRTRSAPGPASSARCWAGSRWMGGRTRSRGRAAAPGAARAQGHPGHGGRPELRQRAIAAQIP